MAEKINEQFKKWTLVGPFFAPPEQSLWFPFPLDGSTQIPSRFSFQGREIPVKKVVASGYFLDLEKILSPIVDRSSRGVRNQSMGFVSLKVSRPVTVTLSFDACWRTVWWLDGKEIFATREGNSFRRDKLEGHRVILALTPGKHVLAVRIISSNQNWNLQFQIVSIQEGITDALRTDRQASWRDYTCSVVRLEQRPVPDGWCGKLRKEDYESLMARMGVQARWISVVHQLEGSCYRSSYLGMWQQAKPDYEKQLKEWVKFLHQKRIAVMSWVALTLNKSAAREHPEWRQQYLVIDRAGRKQFEEAACCINSGYGQALIDFCIEALKKFDLDGIWFDGASFSPVWHRPAIISCVCPCCRKKFKEETGMEIPDRYDWSLPQFPAWVQWRYDMYASYWQHLVDSVHKAVPEATIVFNHYHRENIGWHGAIPLKPFGRNFVSGTEADSEPLRGAFYTRLMRAYGRKHTEVWMALEQGRKGIRNGTEIVFHPGEVFDFVLACATAGGHASVGGADFDVEGPALRDIAELLKPRAPYLNLPSVPCIALHVSQQTETFVFGQDPAFITDDWQDYYWNSLTGWHHLLAYSQFHLDVFFDQHLQLSFLRRYPVIILPLALSLTSTQYEVLMEYVKAGGILFAGPWFSLFDRWGKASTGYPIGDRDLFPFGDSFPSWEEFRNRRSIILDGFSVKPLHALGQKRQAFTWQDVISVRKSGKGKIIQAGIDFGTLFRYHPFSRIVQSFRRLFLQVTQHRPLVEIPDADNIILGIFSKDKKTSVVHLQQFPVPWKPEDTTVEKPPVRWKTTLYWNGKKPTCVRCCLPEISPQLPVRKHRNSYLVELPPFDRGQILLITTED